MRKTLVAAVAVAVFAGCGYGGDGGTDGGNGGDYYVRGDVTIIEPLAGDGFSFDEACVVSSMEMDQEIYWGLEAKDMDYPFGLVITWKQSFITGPGNFQPNEGVADISTMFVRAHPTEPDQIRLSGVGEGSLTFSDVGYQGGDLIAGSFDGFVMERTEPDDTIRIEMDNGVFRCRVQ